MFLHFFAIFAVVYHIICFIFKGFVMLLGLIFFPFRKINDTAAANDKSEEDNIVGNKNANQNDVRAYLSKNRAFFDINAPISGEVTEVVVHEGDNMRSGDVLLYVINQSGNEEDISVAVKCHIDTIFVKEGDIIKKGQKLAEANNL